MFQHATKGCHINRIYGATKPPVCGNCQLAKPDLKVCSRCMKVSYCGRECQKAHYPSHKSQCAPK